MTDNITHSVNIFSEHDETHNIQNGNKTNKNNMNDNIHENYLNY